MRRLFAEGKLVHPMSGYSFRDLAHGLALCCGVNPPHAGNVQAAIDFKDNIGGVDRKHIVVVLCDGMGCK